MRAATTTTTAAAAVLSDESHCRYHYFRDQAPVWLVAFVGLSLFILVAVPCFGLGRLTAPRRTQSTPHWRSPSRPSHPATTTTTENSAWPEDKEALAYTEDRDEGAYLQASLSQPPPPPYQPRWEPAFQYYAHFPSCSALTSIMEEKERNQMPDGTWANRGSFRDTHPQPGIPASSPSYSHYRTMVPRPPPAPPLTPPELSTTVFNIEDRQREQDNFIDQPNPDYTGHMSTEPEPEPKSEPDASPTARDAPAPQPRRMSYNKTVAVGSPASGQPRSRSGLFFPSSSSPGLSRSGPDGSGQREIDVHGEIISMLDQNGTGWTRHTRVYGGGSCLACTAAGRQHGEGGFYGPNVLPEEMMRY